MKLIVNIPLSGDCFLFSEPRSILIDNRRSNRAFLETTSCESSSGEYQKLKERANLMLSSAVSYEEIVTSDGISYTERSVVDSNLYSRGLQVQRRLKGYVFKLNVGIGSIFEVVSYDMKALEICLKLIGLDYAIADKDYIKSKAFSFHTDIHSIQAVEMFYINPSA